MTLIELTGVKGGAVWVNPSWIVCFAAADGGGGSSMYGDNNVRVATKLQFVAGGTIEVKETAAEIAARLEPSTTA